MQHTRPLILSIMLLMSGCTTVEFVRKDFSPQKQAILRYLPASSTEKESKYHEEIHKEATKFCGGAFEITKEYQARDESNTSTGVGTGFGVGRGAIMVGGSSRNTSMYNFVEFSCK